MKFVRRNWGLKLVSLALAYVSWAYVVSRSPVVRFVNAPVELSPPEGMVVTDYSPREVRVRLQGDAPVLGRLSEQNVYVRVVLDASFRPGRPQKVPVQEREIQGVPAGVGKEVVTPAVTVTTDKKITRVVPVKVLIVGAPPRGHKIARATTDPATVEISGPFESLRGVEQVWTEAIDPGAHRRPFTGRADLTRPDTLLMLRPETVRFEVLVEEIPAPVEVELPVEPSASGFDPEPSLVRVRLEGPPSLTSRINEQMTAIADAEGLPEKGGIAPVRIVFGDLAADELARIHVVAIDPPRVRLRRSSP